MTGANCTVIEGYHKEWNTFGQQKRKGASLEIWKISNMDSHDCTKNEWFFHIVREVRKRLVFRLSVSFLMVQSAV